MKRYLSKVIVGCLGICAGFALCYVTLVVPNSGRLSARLKHLAANGYPLFVDPWGNPYVIVCDKPSALRAND